MLPNFRPETSAIYMLPPHVTSSSSLALRSQTRQAGRHGLQIENAGGESSCDGLCVSGLDVEIKEWDQRTQICYGSKGEVRRFEEYLYGESARFAEAEVA